ncbi:MAG: N-acetylmuramoyl-L-alanine amidase [Melioribacteraceae bacterium]|nr:N-acetylmuramoyl-L-alanine amidase [Melioribacteraceae bacterium]
MSCSSGEKTVKLNEFGYESVAYPYYELPPELKDNTLYSKKISDNYSYMNSLKIFLDPGHGGTDRKNTSRDKTVVEADINLNVAMHLEKFLEDSGAEVIFSRVNDDTVSLEERVRLANNSGADLFISIHHNATADSANYWTNYTSTFYHSMPWNYGYEPYEHQIAKYVQRDLAYAMRNPGSLASFDGTMSDFLINRDNGFYVLKYTLIPSILVECSFFTNRLEETRLSIDEFNKVEAWGIYSGLAKFFSENIPEIYFVGDESLLSDDTLKLVFTVNDIYPFNRSGLKIYYNMMETQFEYVEPENKIELILQEPAAGEHEVKIIYENDQNIFSKPFIRKIVIN